MDRIQYILANGLVPVLTGAIIGLVAIGLGAFPARFFSRDRNPSVVDSFALGALIISLVTMLAGTFGLLIPAGRLSLALIFAVLAIIGWIRSTPSLGLDTSSLKEPATLALMLLLVVGLVLPLFHVPLYPPATWDECSYHLPSAVMDVRTGTDTFQPDIIFSNTPRNIEMLFFWAIAWSPLSSSHYVNYLAYIILLLATVRMGALVFSRKVGWLAALMLGAVGYIQSLAVHSKTDIWIVTYLFLVLLNGAEGSKKGDGRGLLLAGVYLGAAAGIKYTALSAIMTLFVALLALRFWRMPTFKPIAPRYYLWAALIAIAIASPWYIRNIVWFHNPFFPFFSSIFPPGGGTYGYYGPESAIDPRAMLARWTIGFRATHSIFIVPLLKLWIVWGAIPLGLLFWRSSPFSRLAVVWALLDLLYWMVGQRGILVERYSMQLAPLTALLAAHLVAFIYSWLARKPGRQWLQGAMWVLLILSVGILGVKVDWGPAGFTPEKQADLLSHNLRSYDLMVAANEVIPQDGVAIGVMCEDGRLYARFTLRGANDVGWANHKVLNEHCQTAEEFARFITERYNAHWLVVNEALLNNPKITAMYRVKLPVEDPMFPQYFIEERRIPIGVVYRVNAPSEANE